MWRKTIAMCQKVVEALIAQHRLGMDWWRLDWSRAQSKFFATAELKKTVVFSDRITDSAVSDVIAI